MEQAAYNITGADLVPSSATTRKRIATALRKALGKDVNATLLDVTAPPAAAAAADDSSSATPGAPAAAPDATSAAAPDTGRAGTRSFCAHATAALCPL